MTKQDNKNEERYTWEDFLSEHPRLENIRLGGAKAIYCLDDLLQQIPNDVKEIISMYPHQRKPMEYILYLV